MAPRTDGIELVVMGASAGGVEALCVLLAGLPSDFKPPVVIVLHLPADTPSMLPEVLSYYSALPVRDALDKAPVEDGIVYCAPSDCHVQVEPDRSFSLSIDAAVKFSRPSIDVLFESAALAYGSKLLAIVLTGASTDGADGLAMVRAQGGVAWVQRPDEAAVDVMPLAAIARAGADQILSLQEMTFHLARIT